MVSSVELRDEVFLGGIRFKLEGRMQSQLASTFPAKVVIGDSTRDSHPRASVLALSDYRGGIGRDKVEEAAEVDRAWYGNLNLRHRNNLVLPRLATETAAGPTGTIGVLVEFLDEVYATFSTSVRKYDNDADSWGNSLHTLPAAATDALVARVNGTVLLFIAHATGYSYTEDGSSWTDGTEDIKYLAWWDHKVFGIDNTGQLRFTTWGVAGEWIDDAQLPLPDGYVTDLFEGRDAGDNSILYAMTEVGLFAHDFANGQFIATDFTLPKHDKNGLGSVRWRGAIYIPAGNGIYKYQDGASKPPIGVVGPDRDDGLPADRRGSIDQLVASHNQLIAVVNSPTASTDLDMFVQTESPVFGQQVGISVILGWDELGWQVLWEGAEEALAVGSAIVSNAYDKYRLWWAQGNDVFFQDLPVDITNPDQLPEARYAASGVLETPWFNMGQDEVNKLALHIDAVMSHITFDETITLSYALNLVDDYTEIAVIDRQPPNGHRHYHLPSAAQHVGIPFFWIRFKIEMVRGPNTSRTPHLHSLTLTFRKKLDLKLGFQFNIDMRGDYDGRSPQVQRAELRKLLEKQELIRFTYRRDDHTTDALRHYFVDILSATNLEETGLEERGISQITLAEV